RPGHVRPAVAEALLAEVVGDAAAGHGLEARLDGGAVALHVTQDQDEAVARQRAARQLARVPRLPEHAQPLPGGGIVALQRLHARRLAPGQLHAEALARDRVAVLQAGVADRALVHPGPLRQQARDEGGVHAALLDAQQQVLARAAGLEAVELGDIEVLRRHADARG